jgi:hypothetical protein
MEVTMKKLVTSILAAILLFGACGGSGGSPTDTSAPARY